MFTLIAFIPFIVFFILLLWKKTSLLWVSLITLFLLILLAVVFWRMDGVYITGSIIKGFFVALDIFFIIFGAIFFLDVMKQVGVIENAGKYLESISKDIRVKVILLAWFFENFLEGTAGFGTPSTVVAPLLVGLGLAPIDAVIISLFGNSTSVVFGAAGTPIKAGFAGLYGASLPFKAAVYNVVGFIVPVFILWFLVRRKVNAKKEFLEMLPFAVWSGFAFVIPSIFVSFLGIEFPSILGSVIGLGIVLASIKLKLFMPKDYEVTEKEMQPATLPINKVLLPYGLLILLLVAGKFILGSSGITFPTTIKHTFAFYNPGFAFIISGIFSVMFFKIKFNKFSGSFGSSFIKSIAPFLVIVSMSAIAQIMVNSTVNSSNLASMVEYLAVYFKNNLLPIWSPVIGAFGSFLTGSATVSNLMFGSFLANAAESLSFNVDKILALAVVGGAAGNMIALADVLVAETVVGIKHQERTIIGKLIIPCLIYVGMVGLAGLLIF